MFCWNHNSLFTAATLFFVDTASKTHLAHKISKKENPYQSILHFVESAKILKKPNCSFIRNWNILNKTHIVSTNYYFCVNAANLRVIEAASVWTPWSVFGASAIGLRHFYAKSLFPSVILISEWILLAYV